VSCFLTPDTASAYTYPPALREEIERIAEGYEFDATPFRTETKEVLLERAYRVAHKRFRVARHLVRTRPWDLFAMVEIGTDRVQHAFWRYTDAAHPSHKPWSRFENAILDYYRFVDGQLGELLEEVGPDATVIVLSDHGVRPMVGGFRINEWLRREGYLRLSALPESPRPLSPELVDWANTRAWADGGYCGRIYLNVWGREPLGVVAPRDYEKLRTELIAKLSEVPSEDGQKIRCAAHRPEDLYTSACGYPPDLIVYCGDLSWRVLGTVGGWGLLARENDHGPDGANHDWAGIFLMRDRQNGGSGNKTMDLCATQVSALIGEALRL